MLERATACLKAGARDSLRCTSHTPRSQRMLHSTFWTHGAGDLDLPPWALSMGPPPADLPLKHDSTPSRKSRTRSAKAVPSSASDGLFLDFLYPPQALAWLHRTNGQNFERWEKRNARRLPEGFIQASRGYSSRSYSQKAAASSNAPEDGEEEHETLKESGFVPLTAEPEDGSHSDMADAIPFGETPGETLETNPLEAMSSRPEVDALHQLRKLLSAGRSRQGEDTLKHMWSLYNALDEDDKSNVLLKREFLLWLGAQGSPLAAAHCISLYWSLPLEQRPLEVYHAALSSFLYRNDFDFASGLHQEALANIPNGSQISKVLFRYAIEHHEWLLALRTQTQHDEHFSGPGQAHHRATFWFHVAEIDGLVMKANRMLRRISWMERKSLYPEHIDQLFQLATKLAEEAILQLARSPIPPRSSPLSRQERDKTVQNLTNTLIQRSAKAGDILAAAIPSILQQNWQSRAYPNAHSILSHLYSAYRNLPNTRPSEELLMMFLERLKFYWDVKEGNTRSGLGIETIFSDWRRCHDRVSLPAIEILLSFYARHGHVEKVSKYLEYAKAAYPAYEDYKSILWAAVYVHARRVDLPKTLEAFGEVESLAKMNNDQPSAHAWSSLFLAYGRADDLDGAFALFKKFVKAGMVPNTYAVHPITEMMARRGDLEGVDYMMEQYSTLSGRQISLQLIGSRLNALIKNGRVYDAERALDVEVERTQNYLNERGQSYKSLTVCCNIVLTAYALLPDIDATMRIYRLMKSRSIPMNSLTYSALMQALVLHRQTDAAKRVMTHIMPRENLRPTALHYGILINGYINQKLFINAIGMYSEMRRSGFQPSIATTRAYLKAVSYFENARGSGLVGRHQGRIWSRMRRDGGRSTFVKDVQDRIANHQETSLAEKGPRYGVDATARGTRINEFVDYAMFLHARANNLETVMQLFQTYEDEVQKRGLAAGPPPMRILTALMNAHFHARKFDMVEAYWKIAKDQADMFAPTTLVPDFRQHVAGEPTSSESRSIAAGPGTQIESGEVDRAEIGFAPTTQEKVQGVQTIMPNSGSSSYGPKPAPGRTDILTRPLRYYLRTLLYQNRINDMINVVTRLLSQGYRFDIITWNRFVEYLCQAPIPPLLLAFTLTENYLMPGFPGWVHHRARWPTKRGEKLLNFQYMNVRYEHHKTLRPHYRTLLYLGRGIMELQRAEAIHGERSEDQAGGGMEKLRGTMRQIRHRAPKTMAALETMPVAEEKWQARILRNEG